MLTNRTIKAIMKAESDINRIDSIAPCGVYCGACPSFEKTCNGCASDDKKQNRCSKWNCKIRGCCYNKKKLDYCVFCDEFPCKLMNKKLIDSHPGDLRFTYRHEIQEVFIRLKNSSLIDYLNFQKQRWKCGKCDGTIQFYTYKCNKCGNKQIIKLDQDY